MKVSLFGSSKTVGILPQNICYICVKGYNCKTFFSNGNNLNLSYSDMKTFLENFPRAYSHDLKCGVYINTQQLSHYTPGAFYNMTFSNGVELNQLSGYDCDKIISNIESDFEM